MEFDIYSQHSFQTWRSKTGQRHGDSLISFMEFYKRFCTFFFPSLSKAEAKLGLCLAPGTCTDVPLGACRPAPRHLSPALLPETEIRYPQHQPESGTSNLKRSGQLQTEPRLQEPWRLCRRPWATSARSSLVFRTLANNKRSAIGGSLYLNYLKKKKNLMSSEHFTCCSPT